MRAKSRVVEHSKSDKIGSPNPELGTLSTLLTARTGVSALFLGLVLGLTAAAMMTMPATARAFSLQDAIGTTFVKNPKTRASDLRLEAMDERTKASWLAFLPRLNVGYSRGLDRSTYSGADYSSAGKSSSQNWSAGLSVNIFNGGADLNNALAAEANARATRARNSAASNSPQSVRGALANVTMNQYTRLVRIRSQIELQKSVDNFLIRLQPLATDPGDVAKVKSAIDSIDYDIESSRNDEISAQRDFEYVVKLNPTNYIFDSYEQIIKSLNVPTSVAEAQSIAREKSQELLASRESVMAARHSQKAREGANLPAVNLSFNHNSGSTLDSDDILSRSKGSSVRLQVSMSIDVARFAINSASQKEVTASEIDAEEAEKDLNENIASVYLELQNYTYLDSLNQANVTAAKKRVDQLSADMNSGRAVKVTDGVDAISYYESQVRQSLQMKQAIASTRFRLQRLIGTLVDTLDPTLREFM